MTNHKLIRVSFWMTIVGLLGIGEAAFGGQFRPIFLNGDYAGPVSRYLVYKNGIQVCTISNPVWPLTCEMFIDDKPMTIAISAVDATGAQSEWSDPYILLPPPITAGGNYIPYALLQTDVSSGPAPLTVGFDGSKSYDIGGTITRFDWAFGNGDVGAGKLIDYTYLTPATYSAILTVTDDGGATANTTAAISVLLGPPPTNIPPVATFTATILEAATSTVGFDGSTSKDPDGTILNYSWNFGDGSIATGPTVSHRFVAAGDYTVTLTVTDNQGATGQDQLIISIIDQTTTGNLPPVAAISTSVSQQLLSVAWSYDPNAQNLAGFRLYQNSNLVCQIADPTARRAECPLYLDYGQVNLYLVSYDLAGAESNLSEVFPFTSVGVVTLASSGEAPLQIHCSSGPSFDPDGSIVSYTWNFGDGVNGKGPVIDHTYAVPGNYTIALTVSDDRGATAQATSNITVNKPKNLPPKASDLSLTTNRNIAASGVLNASDPEGAPLLFRIVSNGSKGDATLLNPATGSFRYLPNHNSTGTDLFTFIANDGTLDSNLGTVALLINQTNSPPQPSPLAISVAQDSTITGFLTATDADFDSLTYALRTTATLGAAVVTDPNTGAFSYTPNPKAYGSDSFTYIVNDGFVDSSPATVSVTITKVNHPPTAFDDTAITDLAIPVTIDPLANDSDPDGTPLQLTKVSQPGHGSAGIAQNTVVYTPNPGYLGVDSFTYTASDGELTAEGTVVVTVTPPHLLISASWSFDPTVVDLSGFRFYENGSPVCSVLSPTARQLACLTLADQAVKSFAIAALDLNGNPSLLSNILTYNPNRPPLANPDLATTSEDTPIIIAPLTNDSDPDGDLLTLQAVTPGAHGQVTSTGNQAVYTPSPGFYGSDSFTYTVTDSRGSSAVATVTVTVTQVYRPPVIADDTAIAEGGSQVTIDVLANDADPDQRPLTLSSVTAPLHGTAALANNKILYTPALGFSGIDSFTYTVSDGIFSAVGKVVVTVKPPSLLITASWSYDPALAAGGGFRLYANGLLACTTADASARTLSCVLPKPTGPLTLALSAVDISGVESSLSNPITY